MRHYVPLILAFTLLLSSCRKEDDEDPSEIEKMVLLEEEEEDSSLIQDADSKSVADEFQPVPHEMINQKEGSTQAR